MTTNAALLLVLLLLTLVVMATGQTSNNTIDTWSASLSTQLKSLRDRVMKVTGVAALLANTSYTETALDADALAAQLEAKLTAVLRAKQAIVAALALAVETEWASSKGLAETTSCQWNDASQRLTGLKANPIYNDSVSHDFSAVKLARDAKPSQRDICFTEALDRVFAANDPQKNLPWQYFGSNTGYHRQYPASFRGSDYDARSRPWYTGASSGPKDVLLILDVSGSMSESNRLELMKDAATTVLSSLTVNDYVNVVTFSSDANTFECMANTMLPADSGTIAYLTDRIGSLRATGSTDFYKAFALGFDVLDRSKRAGATTGCEGSRTILFLTDGVPSNTEDHLALIAERNRDSKVTIFTYALGASARIQDDIACQHNGAYTFIQDGGNLRTKMQSYYKVFGATANRELFWTAPYLDASGLGMMVTAALPTYDTSQEYPELLGVVGHDILLSDFTALVSTFNSDRSYAFLVDRRGNAISHPRMSANTNPNAAPIYQDISVLENNNSTEFLSKVRQPLLSGEPGKQKLIAVRVLTRGDSSDGVTFEKVAVTYVWRPVGPFVACYVLADDDIVSLTVEDGDVRWPSYYHNLKLYGDTINRALKTTQFPSTHNKYPNALLLTNATTFYLAPRAFIDPASRVRREPTESAGDVAVLHAAINEEGRDDASSGLRNGVRALARRLGELDALWSGVDQNETALGWIYFGAAQGVHRRYPGGDQAFIGYDPTVRPWYLRAKALPNALVVSAPYTDASGLGRVCTLAHTVPRRALDTGVGGVIGLDFQHAAFQSIVHTNRSACFGAQRESCFAIESSGLLVTSEVTRHDLRNARDAVFIGAVEPGVTQALVAAGFLEPQSYVDFQAQQECQAYKANNGALDAVRELQVSTCGSGTIRVRAVTIDSAVTNMYVIQVSDWRSSANGCVTTRRGCFPLAKPSPCKPMEMAALPRAKAPCSKVVITEAFLEHLRAQDPDGGLCGGLSSVEIAVIVICVILGAILLCAAIYCVFFKKRNGSQPKPNY